MKIMGICRSKFEIPTRPLEGQKFIYFIFVTLSSTVGGKITTFKNGTYPYAFLPKTFQQNYQKFEAANKF